MATKYPGGLSTIPAPYAVCDIPEPFRPRLHTYFDDFDRYVATEWDVTETQAGATQAQAAGDGGRLLLTNSAADNDVNSVQVPVASFRVTTAAPLRRCWFGSRLQLSDITDSDMITGLVVDQGTAATLTPTHGVFFRKADDAATVVGVIRNAGTETATAALATLSAATDYDFMWCFDGSRVTFEVRLSSDQSLVGRASISDLTNLPIGTDLAPILFLQNGAAAAKTLNADWLWAAKERF